MANAIIVRGIAQVKLDAKLRQKVFARRATWLNGLCIGFVRAMKLRYNRLNLAAIYELWSLSYF